jgi:hypothetical protein
VCHIGRYRVQIDQRRAPAGSAGGLARPYRAGGRESRPAAKLKLSTAARRLRAREKARRNRIRPGAVMAGHLTGPLGNYITALLECFRSKIHIVEVIVPLPDPYCRNTRRISPALLSFARGCRPCPIRSQIGASALLRSRIWLSDGSRSMQPDRSEGETARIFSATESPSSDDERRLDRTLINSSREHRHEKFAC